MFIDTAAEGAQGTSLCFDPAALTAFSADLKRVHLRFQGWDVPLIFDSTEAADRFEKKLRALTATGSTEPTETTEMAPARPKPPLR